MENEKDTFKAFIQSCIDFCVNNKKEEKVCNEDVDKRKLIDEVAGIMKSAGCDDEVIRTAIGKMEKIGYDKSEAKTADNEEEEEKAEEKEADEKEEKAEDKKAENEKDYMSEVAQIAKETVNNEQSCEYVTRQERLEQANEYFKIN